MRKFSTYTKAQRLGNAVMKSRLERLLPPDIKWFTLEAKPASNGLLQCYALKKFLERLKRNNRHLSYECNKILIVVCTDIYYYQRKNQILKGK